MGPKPAMLPPRPLPRQNKRRSMVKVRSSPKSILSGGIRKKPILPLRGTRTAFADKNQVDVLQRGLQMLHNDQTLDTKSSTGVKPPGNSAMKVAVRVRPLNTRELTANTKKVIAVSGPNMLVFDPEVEREDFFFKNQKLKDVTARKYKNMNFAFDHVFGETTDNETIYQDIMHPLLDTLLGGFNCSVFAYGATGSGKTYTMLGSPGNHGLTYLTIKELFDRLDGMRESNEIKVGMCYYEVYNEQVHDLLNPTGTPLAVMEVYGGHIQIKGLAMKEAISVDQMIDMLLKGNKNRSQHPTDHNAESSRSHAVLEVRISIREKHTDMTSNSRQCKLVMVDLAGSEKGAATGCSGSRFREGANINKSLLALGKVIQALASKKKTFSFRDSKLTRILKDSLGGNCKTVMIANASPSDLMYEDTLNTLRYAEKAKKISCNPSRNVKTVQSCLAEYTRVVDEMTDKLQTLEKQNSEKDNLISEMRIKIEQLENGAATALPRASPVDKLEPKVDWSRIEHVRDDAVPYQIVRMEKLFLEYQLNLQQFQFMNSLHQGTGDSRYEKCSSKMKKRLVGLSKQLHSLFLDVRVSHYNEISNAKLLPGSTNERVAQAIEGHDPSYRMSVEIDCQRQQINKMASNMVDREALLKDFSLIANKFYNQLKHYKLLTPAMETEYDKVVAAYTSTSLKFEENHGVLVDSVFDFKCAAERSQLIRQYLPVVKKRLENIEEHGREHDELASQIAKIKEEFEHLSEIYTSGCLREEIQLDESAHMGKEEIDPKDYEMHTSDWLRESDGFKELAHDNTFSGPSNVFNPTPLEDVQNSNDICKGIGDETFTLAEVELGENIDPMDDEKTPNEPPSQNKQFGDSSSMPLSSLNAPVPCSSQQKSTIRTSPIKLVTPKGGINSGSASRKIPVPIVPTRTVKSPEKVSSSSGKVPSSRRNSNSRKSPYSSAQKVRQHALMVVRTGAQKPSTIQPRPTVPRGLGGSKR